MKATPYYYRKYCPPNSLFTGNLTPYNKKALKPDYRELYVPAASQANILLLAPVIFGGAATFILGFVFFGRSLKAGYKKFITFMNILGLLVTFGTAIYVYQLFKAGDNNLKFNTVVWASAIIILFYGSTFNLIYSLYPHTFEGIIGKTPLTQFLSFLMLSIGSVSIGESFGVNVADTGVQVLAGIEALFNLYVLSLIVSLVV